MSKTLEEVKLENLLWIRESMLAKLSALKQQIEDQRLVVLRERDAKLRTENGLPK